MTIQNFIPILVLISLSSFGQGIKKTAYFKSDSLAPQITDQKLSETTPYDTLIKKELIDVKSQQKLWTKTFKNGKPFGVWYYYNNSEVIDSIRYGEYIPKDAFVVDFITELPMNIQLGSWDGYSTAQYLIDNVNALKDAVTKSQPNGVLEIQLTVEPNGKIANVSILKSIDEIFDKAVYNLIIAMPGGTPATRDGEPIQIYMTRTLPIFSK